MILKVFSNLTNNLILHVNKVLDGYPITGQIMLIMILLYGIYDQYGRPPRHLRNLPYNNIFKTSWKVITGVPTRDIHQDLSVPLIKNPDCHMYVRLERLGWTVHLTTPQAAKILLSSSSKKIAICINHYLFF